ncbi:MAG TPA: hypothetical protein VF469_27775 [Kofleriaceae bacterium]
MALRYKFVELSVVTAGTLEQAVNDWVGQGWQLDAIRFVGTEHGPRPAMAFLSFTREVAPEGDAGEGTRREISPPPHVIVADDNDVE